MHLVKFRALTQMSRCSGLPPYTAHSCVQGLNSHLKTARACAAFVARCQNLYIFFSYAVLIRHIPEIVMPDDAAVANFPCATAQRFQVMSQSHVSLRLTRAKQFAGLANTCIQAIYAPDMIG
jgi:hypothetical protein